MSFKEWGMLINGITLVVFAGIITAFALSELFGDGMTAIKAALIIQLSIAFGCLLIFGALI